MKLDKKSIKHMEVVGKTEDGSDILRIETKGGLNIVIKKSAAEFKILGQAGHFGISRHHANLIEKNIQWSEHLFKSEGDYQRPDSEVITVVESTPDKHISTGIYHSFMSAKTADVLNRLSHTDTALAHFKAAGLSQEKAQESLKKAQSKLQKNHVMDEPYDTSILELAYEKKYKKPFPTGIDE